MALSALTQPHRRRETPGKAASLSSIYLIFFNTIGNVFSKLDAKTQFSAPLLLGPRGNALFGDGPSVYSNRRVADDGRVPRAVGVARLWRVGL